MPKEPQQEQAACLGARQAAARSGGALLAALPLYHSVLAALAI